MKKQILTLAILLALPLTAMAENISGAMYVAPLEEDENHPGPTTNADISGGGRFGRINIDTTDREHVASTAYVKGAYNSAIAAVNMLNGFKQDKIVTSNDEGIAQAFDQAEAEELFNFADMTQPQWSFLDNTVLSTAAVFDRIKSQRATVYTTWDNDNATRQVAFVTASNN